MIIIKKKTKTKELFYINETRWLNVKELMIKLGLLCVCLEASRYHYTASSGEPTHTQMLIAIEQTTPRKSVWRVFIALYYILA